jgi:hypothetical protein
MKVSYRFSPTKLSFAYRQLLVAAGLLALPLIGYLETASSPPEPKAVAKISVKPAPEPPPPPDPRTVRLSKFLTRLRCPVFYLSGEFVQAADENGLDWRLLPSISVIESGGGKAYRNNNIFGWGNGDILFKSLQAGIHEVAFKLGRSPLYRNRNVEAKLRIYNPNEEYAANVMAVMNRISPVVKLKSVARVVSTRRQPAYVSD